MPRSRLILRPSLGEIILNYGTLAGGILLNVAWSSAEAVRMKARSFLSGRIGAAGGTTDPPAAPPY